jgi:4-oxalocrotonate tautomerase
MPTFFFYGPELNTEKKRELVKTVTDKASELTGIDKSAFVVYLQHNSTDDVGVGGELLSDKMKREHK